MQAIEEGKVKVGNINNNADERVESVLDEKSAPQRPSSPT